MDHWINISRELRILVSPNFSLVQTLGDPIERRSWHLAGLPEDQISVERGIYIQKAPRWPLIIDPTQQAAIWLETLYRNRECESN